MVEKENSAKIKVIDNLEVHSDHVVVSVNPKIYGLTIVYSAAYVMMDKAYVVIDGDPEEEILVEIRPKDKRDAEEIGRDFNNELINYAVYQAQSAANQEVKEAIVKRAMMTNVGSDFVEEDEDDDASYLDDPEGIAVPWEEKYGKDE